MTLAKLKTLTTLLRGKMMTDYNNSVWRSLGHPAFDLDYEIVVDDVEWWDPKEDKEND
jgi:hypothetical protein